MNNQITDTATADRQRAIAGAGHDTARMIQYADGQWDRLDAERAIAGAGHDTVYHCDDCGHDWTGRDMKAVVPCPACGSLAVLESAAPVTLKEARTWVYRGTTTRTFANQFMGWMFSDTQDAVIQAEVRLFLSALNPEEREEMRKKATT